MLSKFNLYTGNDMSDQHSRRAERQQYDNKLERNREVTRQRQPEFQSEVDSGGSYIWKPYSEVVYSGE